MHLAELYLDGLRLAKKARIGQRAREIERGSALGVAMQKAV